MKNYDPEKLERCIASRGRNKWHWGIAEKGKRFIVHGDVNGARNKAVRAANDAYRNLKSLKR